jgi:uncharacterized BrkB/YihY/UPF0761 family membrane protein
MRQERADALMQEPFESKVRSRLPRMVGTVRRVGAILYGAAVELIADNGLVLAASIAFFTIFSLAPLLLLVVALAGLSLRAGSDPS